MLKPSGLLNLLYQGSKRANFSELTTRQYKNLQRTQLGIAYLANQTSRRKTKDLVGLLLTHGEQARRCSMPKTTTALSVTGSNGMSAIKIRMN